MEVIRSEEGDCGPKVLKDLSDVHFPAAEKIVLVQDNLSTHTPASLYAAFPAPEARRLVEMFEWRYTPKYGSWLHMAEVRTRRSDQAVHHAKADWKFTTHHARVKLKRLYP